MRQPHGKGKRFGQAGRATAANRKTGRVKAASSGLPATNSAAVVVTNTTVERVTNLVAVTYTNWVERPEVRAGLYGAWARLKNRKVNEALVQGVETARAMLEQTPQGQAVDAEFVRWLQAHQKEAGVFVAVSRLVDQYSDNPAARVAAQEIAGR